MITIPILILNEQNDIINTVFYDTYNDIILIGTSKGEILKMDKIFTTAYLTGERSVFAQIQNGFGNISNIAWSNFTYQLKDQIIQMVENKNITTIKQIQTVYAASMLESKSEAIFTSPILTGGEDFITWRSMEWQQSCTTGTEINIYLRVANTKDEILTQNWIWLTSSNNTGSVVCSLDNFTGLGSYLQFKIILSSTITQISPAIYNLNVFYKTIHSDYFFTQKYILKKNTNADKILLTANIMEPQYTKIKFGLSDGKSTEWQDYINIDINKINSIPSSLKNRIKIGIKFISHTPLYYPVVNEFALMLKGEQNNLLNK